MQFGVMMHRYVVFDALWNINMFVFTDSSNVLFQFSTPINWAETLDKTQTWLQAGLMNVQTKPHSNISVFKHLFLSLTEVVFFWILFAVFEENLFRQ